MIRIFIAGSPMPPNATRREHWSVRSKDSETFRNAAFLTAQQAMRKSADTFPYEPAILRYDFSLLRRSGDLDGLIAAAKPILDGIVDAGVLVDDRVGKLDEVAAAWFPGQERGVWVSIGRVGELLPRVVF